MKKILLWFMLFIFGISSVFAFDASLSTNTTNANINSSIQLTLKLSVDQNAQVKIAKIKWLENFDVVWQRQFQSSSSQVTIVNGQTKSVNTTTYTLILSLSAKKSWDYTIWPAILEIWNKTYKTNQVDVKITWAKIMLNNTQNYQPQQNSQTQKNKIHNPVWWVRTLQQSSQQPKIKDFENEVKKMQPNDNSKIFLIIALLIFIWLIIVIQIYINSKKEDTILLQEEEKWDIKVIEKEEKEIEQLKKNKIDFEKQQLLYPNIDDKDFESKLDRVFRQKLTQKFNILNAYTKTYSEILSLVNSDEKVKEIINWLKLLKYSNLVIDIEKLLTLVKEL